VVQLAGGSYGSQAIDGTKAAPGVVFRPASGQQPVFNVVEMHGENVELRDVKATYWDVIYPGRGFVARNVDVEWFETHGGRDVTVVGGDIGPSYNPGGSSANIRIGYGANNSGVDQPTRNLVIDGVYIHDFRRGTDADHMECLFVIGVDGMVLRNSTLVRCDIYAIFFTRAWWSNAGIIDNTNILLENNVFDESTNHGQYQDTYDSVRFSDWMNSFVNITVRYNSFRQDFSFGDNPKQNVQVYGNIAPRGWCSTGNVNYHHNVWQWDSNEPCGPTDKVVVGSQWGLEMLGFQNPGAIDLHLKPGSPGINAGSAAAYPQTDKDGKARPVGGAPDAGAYESG
jgi:hypothetical protein